MSNITDDFRFVFGSEEGKRVLSHLCRECGVLRPSFVPGMNPNDAIFMEGQRNVAFLILTALDETPERFLELAQEMLTNV